MFLYNPFDEFYKSKLGAVCTNDKVTFRTYHQGANCTLVVINDKTNEHHRFHMKKTKGVFHVEISLGVGLYWYYFEVEGYKFIVKNNDYLGHYSYFNHEKFQLTVYSEDYTVPDWLKGGIIYQIFPDRFCKEGEIKTDRFIHKNWYDTPYYKPDDEGEVRNNDFFGGNFKGIISKLSYLKSLNVSAIYLNPIFKATSNHRYDTGDFFKIDELLGTEEDLKELIKKAKQFGIKIILDGVFNHTGDDSVYFNKYGNYGSDGAYLNPSSKYRQWFNFKHYPDLYESWWGIKTLPQTNKNNPDYIDFICGKNGVLAHYTKLGIGGWRLDVVDELNKNFVENVRKGIKSINKDSIIIGEVWEDASNKISYGERRAYFQGKELDSVMNYPLKNAILSYVIHGDGKGLIAVIKEQIDHYPKAVLDSLMNILATHDTYRVLSTIGATCMYGKTKEEMEKYEISGKEYDIAKQKEKVASLLQFTLYGVPSIYYGDEIGMQGCSDPLNRKGYAWGKEDEELLSWYRKIGNIRSSYSCFESGDIVDLFEQNGFVSFKRVNEENEIYVACNMSQTPETICFDGELYDFVSDEYKSGEIRLKPTEFCVLVKK